jgi:glycosyltransferase involved in cell wall biosynthesis
MSGADTSAGGSSAAPRLSIVIATWEAAATLERCLASIIEQDFTSWELVIADGASTDATVDILHEHEAHISWWESEKDEGIYDAWNKALGHASGDYVCFLGADDAWADARALSRLFASIGDDEYDVVTSIGRFTDSSSGKVFEFGSAFDYRRLGRRMVVCHPGMLHRRTLFDDYGRYDTRYRIAGDLDFLLRLPPDVRALHVDTVSVIVEAAGISRRNVLPRLREQREVLRRCPRYGPVRAYLAWLDKLWRFPIAQLLDISH